MKTIAIAIVTWPNMPDRLIAFTECVLRCHLMLDASIHEIKYVASSERADEDAERSLRNICNRHDIHLQFRPQGNDLGANMNAALTLGESMADYVLLVQDDMFCYRPYDLSVAADALDRHPEAELCRFGWHYTKFTGSATGGFQWIDMTKPWPYADEPHMRRADGTWRYIEGATHGAQEGHLLRQFVDQGKKLIATDRKIFDHGGIDSTIKERRT